MNCNKLQINYDDIDANYCGKIISKLFNVPISDIEIIGSGSYSLVFAINDKQVLKIFKDKYTFKDKYIDTDMFFDPAAFREVMFNAVLKHPNISYYDEIKDRKSV